jgi:DNA polymerase-3 subunit alpha
VHGALRGGALRSGVRFGLGAIKGVGEAAIAAIFEAREKMPGHKFENLESFFENVDMRRVNKKVIESMIKAGALDGFGYHRAMMMNGYHKFLERGEVTRKDRESGQSSLFDLGPAQDEKVVLDQAIPWTRMASLSYEKEILGFYLSDHPLKGYEKMASVWVSGTVTDLPQILLAHKQKLATDNNKQKYDFRNRDGNKKRVIVAGIISESRELITKKGTRMAFAKVEDLTGSCELVVFPDTYSKFQELLKDERPLMIGGFLEGEEGVVKIIVDSMVLLEDALKKTKTMVLHLHKLDEIHYEKLYSLLADNPGQTQLEVVLEIPDLKQLVSMHPEGISGVQISSELLENINSHFGRMDFIEMRTT